MNPGSPEDPKVSRVKAVFDAAAERLIGLGGVGALITESISPDILVFDINTAIALGACGFFLSTGRADAIAKAVAGKLKKAFRDD